MQIVEPAAMRPACSSMISFLAQRAAPISHQAQAHCQWAKTDMSQSPGTYRRLTGMLRVSGSSPVLELGDNRILHLVTDEDLRAFDASLVIVEGTMSGGERLKVEWVGRAES